MQRQSPKTLHVNKTGVPAVLQPPPPSPPLPPGEIPPRVGIHTSTRLGSSLTKRKERSAIAFTRRSARPPDVRHGGPVEDAACPATRPWPHQISTTPYPSLLTLDFYSFLYTSGTKQVCPRA